MDANTILGAPGRDEAEIKGISSYLNRRLWKIPQGVEVRVHELRSNDQTRWPRSEHDQIHRINSREIKGAFHFITYADKSDGSLDDSGSVPLSDGTKVHWFLWSGARPHVHSYAARGSYVAALYRNELYDVSTHVSAFRNFGISESAVRDKLWFIVEPLEWSEATPGGVYPQTARSGLLSGDRRSLPYGAWGEEFARALPEALRAALAAARTTEALTVDDDSWRERLAERFGDRWRLSRLRVEHGGSHRVAPGATEASQWQRSSSSRASSDHPNAGGSANVQTGSIPGPAPARQVTGPGGIPRYQIVTAKDVGESYILAVFQPVHTEYKEGVVLVNGEHPVLDLQIRHFQSQYPMEAPEKARAEVCNAYGEVAVAKVAHSEHLKSIMPRELIEKELRSPMALTMSLLGLMAEEAYLRPRLNGKFGRHTPVQAQRAEAGADGAQESPVDHDVGALSVAMA